jgi:hypothetical protein
MAPEEEEFDGTAFADECFACHRMTPAWKVVYSDVISGAYRSFHACKEEHWALTHADWWTDVVSGNVAERIQILDPSKGDGGTTWSGAPLPAYG